MFLEQQISRFLEHHVTLLYCNIHNITVFTVLSPQTNKRKKISGLLVWPTNDQRSLFKVRNLLALLS